MFYFLTNMYHCLKIKLKMFIYTACYEIDKLLPSWTIMYFKFYDKKMCVTQKLDPESWNSPVPSNDVKDEIISRVLGVKSQFLVNNLPQS